MHEFLFFMIGFLLGGVIGISIMCLMQINRIHAGSMSSDMEKTDLCCLCLRRKTLLPESRISRRLPPCILRNTTDLRREQKWRFQI
nr:DUF3789 domain-containing protein [uncultured Blautia sp.]